TEFVEVQYSRSPGARKTVTPPPRSSLISIARAFSTDVSSGAAAADAGNVDTDATRAASHKRDPSGRRAIGTSVIAACYGAGRRGLRAARFSPRLRGVRPRDRRPA